MTRPQIIRADTIDLQDQNAPSAKDHTRQPTNPAPYGDGPPAPHQANALKNAGFDTIEHHTRSPRDSRDLSGKELQLLHDDLAANGHDGADSEHHIQNLQRNGDVNGQDKGDGEIDDQEGEDSMDDDMMDKISSSPSIDSGGYHLPLPVRESSLLSTPTKQRSIQKPVAISTSSSSSPFLTTSIHYPLSFNSQGSGSPSRKDHHQGKYIEQGLKQIPREDSYSSETLDQLTPLMSETRMSYFREEIDDIQQPYHTDFEGADLHHLLLPADDPLLDDSFDDVGILEPCLSGVGSSSEDWSSTSDGEEDDENADDDPEDISFTDPRFVDSGWGGECLREIEDISFEFVYALHTFVATVEGQANAAKGDTMVLLDDTNSYWWLVRVVKDGSIGYLPAEHIETPTERLARLNKHRNIDLSQTMLGDNPEKSKNPLKKAMRRRNAKTVQFAAPTYHEPSDHEYSSEEEDEEGEYPEIADAGLALQSGDADGSTEDAAGVEPLDSRGAQHEMTNDDEIQAEMAPQIADVEQESQPERSRTSEELSDHQDDGISGKSRKGTVRNTDSFFKDDTGETRKMSLTPSLLRDDSSTSTVTPTEAKEIKTRGSLDTFEKIASPLEKPKDEKRKEKKPGMLSGLFKRKDRKSKPQSEDEEPDWVSKEASTSPKVSSDSIGQDTQPGPTSPSRSPQRQTSKLQKSQPSKVQAPTKRSPSREGQTPLIKTNLFDQVAPRLAPIRHSPDTSLDPYGIEDIQRSESAQSRNAGIGPRPAISLEQASALANRPLSPVEAKPRGGMFSPIRDILHSSPSLSEIKPEKVKKAKERMPMDDFDSSPEVEQSPENPIQHPSESAPEHRPVQDRLSESPVQVSPIVHPTHLPPLVGDTSSQEEPPVSPISPASTPELLEAPPEDSVRDPETPASTVLSTRSLPSWSDASLRTYLEDDTDIRDLLVVVHDRSDLKPVGPDHPVVRNLCKEENRRLDDMSSRLDGLLQDLLARKAKAPIPCRRRKVRCDLGQVDNPHDPPCVRCRREKKDCFFTETRRKRKAEDEGPQDLSEEYVVRNRRSQFDTSRVSDRNVAEGQDGGSMSPPDFEHYSGPTEKQERREPHAEPAAVLQGNPLGKSAARNAPVRPLKTTPDGREVTNETAAALFKSPINNPGDALHLLVDAVARSGDLNRQSDSTQQNASVQGGGASSTSRKLSDGTLLSHDLAMAIDPAIVSSSGEAATSAEDEMKDALRAWSLFRFVRAGWFTAAEAISYMDYFYKYLAPLTPIGPLQFRFPASHSKLLNEEPVLAMTLLTIASRFMVLAGPAGQSRSFMVHDKLWMYLQGMITRMFWSQEQSGGGFCGAGATREQRSAVTRGGLRGLGTVESLLLLSEWHPRSMHFPPGDDSDEIMVPLLSETGISEAQKSASASNIYSGWTEPAQRSDKMCWSLVSFAYTLSYELGIFDSLMDGEEWRPLLKSSNAYDSDRANRVGRLLYIFVNLTSGRLGIANILPQDGKMLHIDYFKMLAPPERPSQYPQYSLLTQSNRHLVCRTECEETMEKIQRAWAGLTALMRQGNSEMFESKTITRERIQTGDYLNYLEAYWPRLREWLANFESIADVPPLSRTLLMIEYEYARTYVNSLSLQAVLEKCATTAEETAAANSGGPSSTNGPMAPTLLSSALVAFRKQNEIYIAEVVDASRSMLRHILDGLVPQNGLRHAPVRTYFRILSGAMFLLKTFALGAKKEEVDISLKLLESTVKALRKNVVDDVHLISRIADLLDGLTSSIRTKFVKFAVKARGGNKRTATHTRKPSAESPGNLMKPTSPTAEQYNTMSGQQEVPNNSSYESIRAQGRFLGSTTNLIDPNDSSMTIMPPPDYNYASAYTTSDGSQFYSNSLESLSPPQAYSAQQSLPHSQGLQTPPQQQAQYQQQLQLQQQQQAAFMYAPSSQDYDWLTLDVNPLIHPGQHSATDTNPMGSGPWTGAFGPEIGESLEMLGMLANEGYWFGAG
ncbi:hypothetical protein MMC26_003353 [Xylographa opegraphella]|nr:hypothetical protein [Xylographa opegraphella]